MNVKNAQGFQFLLLSGSPVGKNSGFEDVHSFLQSLMIEYILGHGPPGTWLSTMTPLPPS